MYVQVGSFLVQIVGVKGFQAALALSVHPRRVVVDGVLLLLLFCFLVVAS